MKKLLLFLFLAPLLNINFCAVRAQDSDENAEGSYETNSGNSRAHYNNNNKYKNIPTAQSEIKHRNNNADIKDYNTGLSFGTVELISRLPACKRQTLLNYRRLLRNPSIRRQFYRDLYQRHQFDLVDGCSEGNVRIGYKERAVLLNDPFFRKRIGKLMRRRSIESAIRGDETNLGNDSREKILTISEV